MEPPPADVVSFAERARSRQAATAEASPDDGDLVGHDERGGLGSAEEPALLAREAMFRRFRQLLGGDAGVASGGESVAVLVYDSADDLEPRAGIRGAGAARQLTFEAPGLVLEVQVEGPAHELTCQIVPPQPASLEVLHDGGVLDLGHDEDGVFHAPSLPADAFSLLCVPLKADARPTVTSWISVFDRPLD